MHRRFFVFMALGVALAGPLHAQDQPQPSLGEIARQARKAKEEKDKKAGPPKNVFTDENLLSAKAGNAANLNVLDSSQAPASDRLAAGGAMLERAERALDTLGPLDRASLARLALEGREADFAGRRAWEDKLFSAKEHYVSHGRDLIREMKGVLADVESLTSSGKASPSDPRVQELAHRTRQLMQDAFQTEANFQAVVLEGQELAKQSASR